MPSETARRTDMDPLVSYAFQVDFDNIAVARFNGVDGLSAEVEMIEYRDSVDPNVVHYRQGRVKPARITFKRGVAVGGISEANEFLKWIRRADDGVVESKDITVTVGKYGGEWGGNENPRRGSSEQVVAWTLSGCRPTKWSLGSLEGNSSSALIETLEVVAEKITKG